MKYHYNTQYPQGQRSPGWKAIHLVSLGHLVLHVTLSKPQRPWLLKHELEKGIPLLQGWSAFPQMNSMMPAKEATATACVGLNDCGRCYPLGHGTGTDRGDPSKTLLPPATSLLGNAKGDDRNWELIFSLLSSPFWGLPHR